MLGNEIITFQFGNFSNFVGSHFWNIQEEILYQNNIRNNEVAELNTSLFFRSGQTNSGTPTYSPRVLIFDETPNFGYLSALDPYDSDNIFRTKEKGNFFSQIQNKNVVTWDNSGIEIFAHKTPMKKKQRKPYKPTLYTQIIHNINFNDSQSFLNDVSSKEDEKKKRSEEEEEEEEEEEGERNEKNNLDISGDFIGKNVLEISKLDNKKIGELKMKEDQMKRQKIYDKMLGKKEDSYSPIKVQHSYEDIHKDLNENVNFWCDYLKTSYHPKSICSIDLNTIENFNDYTDGQKIFKDIIVKRKDYMNNARFFMEECDQMQGILIFADVINGYGGIARDMIECISDYCGGKCSIITIGNTIKSDDKNLNEKYFINECVSFSELSNISDLYIPLSEYQCKSSLHPFLNLLNNNKYHSSSILSNAINSMIHPLRLINKREFLTMEKFIKNMQISSRYKVNSLSISSPLHLYPHDTLYNFYDRMSPSIHNSHLMSHLSLRRNEEAKYPFTQSIVIKGIDEFPLYIPTIKKKLTYEEKVMQLFRSQVLNLQKNKKNSSKEFSNSILSNCKTKYEMFTRYTSQSKSFYTNNVYINEPFFIPDSFPNYWDVKVSPKGFINSQKKIKNRVTSIPMTSHLQTTPEIKNYAKELCNGMKDCIKGKVKNNKMKKNKEDYAEYVEYLCKMEDAYGE